MAGSESLDERALILAPTPLGEETSKLLLGSGFTSLSTPDACALVEWMQAGAGLTIIADECLPEDAQDPLYRFIGQQPDWSDLPVILLVGAQVRSMARERLGNLLLLHYPFQPAQLLSLVQAALRTRRHQYHFRDQQQYLRALLEEQLQQLRNDEQAMNQTRKMEAVGQLAGGVAHDFNNLLTGIGGSFELIGRRLERGQVEGLDSLLDRGQDAVRRAARLTHRLLAFSSRQSLETQSIDVEALLQPQRLRQQVAASVNLEVEIPPDLWQAEGDGQQLRESLDNLVLNACEAMPCGGLLRIEAHNERIDAPKFPGIGLASGDYLHLCIRDTGLGMSESTLEHAFEPFFTTKPVGQGIGLGLSMVYGFSKQSRGHVSLHSQLGKGTQVDLYLPRYQAQTMHDGQRPVRANVGMTTGDVLVVEDDTDVRQLLCQTLVEDGLPCCSAGNANEALPILRSSRPISLLISDIGLPGMNGRQLAEIARKLRPHLQVLFITGYAENAMSRSGFLDPGMQLITKPFELKHLRDKVAQILEAR
ncbi:response regulator [Pseudomonas capeferrum]|uniref:response regulator n=1 Tax=Pseudomonas capeferrum TaxID=1495066 RepID=UPI0015E2FB89|nr:response regulator [Pseudomonas capeferrum]MBA1202731.1 response regulator [Pseudomonas capeferrum]